MNITTISTQEYFAWTGNGIFLLAQLFQIIHTCKKKRTDDISYGLQILWLIGNIMYTVFGFIDLSYAMFIGSAISCAMGLIQIIQKIHYDNCYKRNSKPLLEFDEEEVRAII